MQYCGISCAHGLRVKARSCTKGRRFITCLWYFPWQCMKMTSKLARRHLTSPAPQLFTQPFIEAQIKKYQSSASLAFVRGIHWWPVNSPHKGPVTRKCFHLMTSSWDYRYHWHYATGIQMKFFRLAKNTIESSPMVSNIRKNRTDQSGESGSRLTASG